jgi:hypothetical protein
MRTANNKYLQIVEQELRFIACESQQINGCYDIVDEINHAVVSALRALEEHKLSLDQEREELSGDTALAA